MSLENWQTCLLIIFGVFLGFIGGLLGASYILPIVVGDGWWNLIGAFIGVLGAFFAAWANFIWQQSALKRETWRPFSERYEYALLKLRKARDLVEVNSFILSEIGKKAKEAYEVRPKLETRTKVARLRGIVDGEEQELLLGPSLSAVQNEKKLFEEKFNELERLKETLNLADLELAQKCLFEAQKSLSWIQEKMQPTLKPAQISGLEGAVEWFSQLQECIGFAYNAISSDEYWRQGRDSREDIIHKALMESLPQFKPMIDRVITNLERLPKL